MAEMIDQVCKVCGIHFQSIEEFEYCSAQCFFREQKIERKEKERVKELKEVVNEKD
jgi:hypothetical protein